MKDKHSATKTTAAKTVAKIGKGTRTGKSAGKSGSAPQKRKSSTPAVESTYQPKTELGKKLWELRQQIVASGVPLLDEEGIRREVAERRGGVEWREFEEERGDAADLP